MNTSFQQIITETLQNTSWLTFFIVFWIGATLSFSSCTVARIPIVVGYIGGLATSKKRAFILTLSFVSAMILSYTTLGILFGLASGMMGHMIRWSKYFYYLIGGFALLIGIQTAGLVNFKLPHFHRIETLKRKRVGILGAFLFGIIFTVFEAPTCPCCGPVLFIIASLIFIKGNILYAILIFFAYALGQSFPILLIGSFTSIVKYINPRIHEIEPWIKFLGGTILITLGIYFCLVA